VQNSIKYVHVIGMRSRYKVPNISQVPVFSPSIFYIKIIFIES